MEIKTNPAEGSQTNIHPRYMSKAPGSANDYDGSGDWFKIQDFGPTFSGGQASWPMKRW